MAQTINDFIYKVGNFGIARNNKFEVLLPKTLANNAALPDGNDIASYYAESVEIPGKAINTVPTRLHGKTIDRPMEFLYEGPLVITFLLDSRLQVRNYFESWLNLVFPNGDGVSFNPSIPEKYSHIMSINVVENIANGVSASSGFINPVTTFVDGVLSGGKTSPTKADTTEQVTGSFTFYKIYPKAVSGTNVINAGRDFQRVKVAFAFDYMTSTYAQTNPAASSAPALNKGTGTGILGSLNGIAGSVGKTIGGNISSVSNIGNSISKVLGL